MAFATVGVAGRADMKSMMICSGENGLSIGMSRTSRAMADEDRSRLGMLLAS